MTAQLPLSAAFAARCPALGAPTAAIEALLAAAWAAGRAAWPEVALSAEDFAGHLGAHVPEGEEAAAYLGGVAAADLYLACACGRGDGAALLAFDRLLVAEAPVALHRLESGAQLLDEVQQQLRERLLVGEGAKIDGYTGRGPLRAWLRACALRAGLNLLRHRDPAAPGGARRGEDPLGDLPLGGDPELSYIRDRYREAFSRALLDAFGGLPAQQRNVLRMHFVGGLSEEKIGAVLRVHQSTVSRWMAAARQAVLAETRRLLGERLRLSRAEFDSLAGLLQSQLDLSLGGLLRSRV